MSGNLVRVEILGREYTLRSDEGEERVRKIAELVNERLKKISENSKAVSTLNVAVLAAMEIASEYLSVVEGQKDLSRKFEKIQKQSGRLIEMIDSKI